VVVLIVLGFIGMCVSGAFYAYWYAGLRQRLKELDSTEFHRLGLDVGTELLGPHFGNKEAQEFVSKKLYRRHPDSEVVSLGDKVYKSTIAALTSMTFIIIGMLSGLWSGS
jgi:hypothetical protein